MKLIITIDTEADHQRKNTDLVTIENVSFLPPFQKLCEKYNFFPTYLVTYEIATKKKAIDMLASWQRNGKAEIGAHLHPWTTPPFTDGDKFYRYPSELTREELLPKLKELTEIITKNFGKRPTSYRAGRWGFDKRQAGILRELGYLVDCSVTPKVAWNKYLGDPEGVGGPDCRDAMVSPYYLSGLLEIPVTILYTGLLKKEKSVWVSLFKQIPDSLFKKIINRLFFRQKWLRVFHNSSKRDWVNLYQSAKKNNINVLEFMIHSSELMPGGSPYSKTKEAVEFIYQQLEIMFKVFTKKKVEGISLSEFAKNYQS